MSTHHLYTRLREFDVPGHLRRAGQTVLPLLLVAAIVPSNLSLVEGHASPATRTLSAPASSSAPLLVAANPLGTVGTAGTVNTVGALARLPLPSYVPAVAPLAAPTIRFATDPVDPTDTSTTPTAPTAPTTDPSPTSTPAPNSTDPHPPGPTNNPPTTTTEATPAPPTATETTAPAVTANPIAITPDAAMAPMAGPTTEPTSPSTPNTGSYSPTNAVRAFLSTLNLQAGAGPLSGSISGGVVTVTLAAPTVPITLPAGGPQLTFGATTLVVDTATDTVTLSASASSATVTGSLSVTIAHASSVATNPQISGTVRVTGVPVLGGSVTLEGTLSYAGGATSVALTGAVTDPITVANSFVLAAGSTITLSSTSGLTVHGTAQVGPAGNTITVSVDGAIANANTWSLTVATSNSPTYSPVDGFQITPNVTGSIAKADGKVSFSLVGAVNAQWNFGASTLTISQVEFSNRTPGTDLNCPDITAGQVWLDVKGSLDATSIGLHAAAEGCVNLSAKTFSIATTVKTGLVPGSAGYTITDATVTVAKSAGRSISVTAAATVAITNPGHTNVQLPIQFSLNSDGAFVASTGIDLSQLGLGTGQGVLLVASKPVAAYNATAFNVVDPVKLKQGVTVLLSYQPSDQVKRGLAALGLPAISSIQATANLSTSGFSLEGALTIGSRDAGAPLYIHDFANGKAAVYLNTLSIGIATTGTDLSLTIGGTAYLVLPSLYPNAVGSHVNLSLSGTVAVSSTSVTVKLGFDLAGDQGPWTDAFGIPGMSVSRLAGQFGLTITPAAAGIPLPVVAIRVDNLQLPDALGKPLGLVKGSSISLNLALNATSPIVDLTITGPTPGAVALRPFTVAKALSNSVPDSVVTLVEVTDAHLLFAPLGGLDAANEQVNPGIDIVFNARIGGSQLHVAAGFGLLPYPHLNADIKVPGFHIGTLNIDNTHLAITLDANPAKPVANLSYSGGFTDSPTGISFAATFDTGITGDAANAKVRLHITGGQPSYLQVTSDLYGSVSGSAAGGTFAASGYLWMYAAGQWLGQAQFSYSSSTGAAWQQLAATVARAYHDAYNWADWQVAQTLKVFQFTGTQVATGIALAYNEGIAQVTNAMTNGGIGFVEAVSSVRNYFQATDQQFANALASARFSGAQIATMLQSVYGEADRQVAGVMKAAGVGVDQIVAGLQSVFQEGQAALYNTLQSIGSAGSYALDSMNAFFNTGAYNIWTYPAPLAWSLGTINNKVVTGWFSPLNRDEQWYVLPTDSGYAEIVNRNSGLCLMVDNYSINASAALVTVGCTGNPAQQWYLGAASSGKSIGGLSTMLKNRNSRMFADVLGQAWQLNSTVGQYPAQFPQQWNQTFWFLPAIG